LTSQGKRRGGKIRGLSGAVKVMCLSNKEVHKIKRPSSIKEALINALGRDMTACQGRGAVQGIEEREKEKRE